MFCPRTLLCRSFESAPVNCTVLLIFLKCCVRNILVSSLNKVSMHSVMLSQHVVIASLFANAVFQWSLGRPALCPSLQCGSFSCSGNIAPATYDIPESSTWSFSSGLVIGIVCGTVTCIVSLGVLWYRARNIEKPRLALAAYTAPVAELASSTPLARLGPLTPSQRHG
jgi:hypothetical protein